MSLNIVPEYISADDFYNVWGVDLYEKLAENDHSDNRVNIFLSRVERKLKNFVDTNSFRTFNWENMSEFQLEKWQEALLEQAYYMFLNGDASLDSGYDPERGVVVQRHDLNKITIASGVEDILINAGILNFNITNKHRWTRNWN